MFLKCVRYMKIQKISIGSLEVSKFNIRKDLSAGEEDSDLEDLASSIKKHGLLNPLVVRPTSSGKYEIISGHRRYLACKKLGLAEIDCIVREDLDDADSVVVSLIENIHRADVNPIDKARALNQLYERYGSYSRVAEETAWSPTTISKYITLLDLPAELQQKLSTAEGPAKVSAMALLAKTFRGQEAIEVYEKIAGFKQSVQEEILRRSDGDMEKINDLVIEAQEGAFNIHMCGGRYGCEVVKDIIRGEITQEEFQKIIETTAIRVRSELSKETLKKAARAFWKSLARG